MWELACGMLLLGGAKLWLGVRQNRQDRERLGIWQQAAASCGLQQVEVAPSSSLRARAGPLQVRIEKAGDGRSSSRIVVVVPGPRGFHDVVIRPESRLSLSQARDLEIGDRSFDDALTLQGPERLVCSLLDAMARRLLYTLNAESRLEVSGGALQAVAPHLRITYLLPLLLDLGKRFAEAMDDPRRLAEIAHRDPVKEVRLRSLRLLIRELPGAPTTADALRDACSDPSPEIRLRAALELGDAGRAVLHELAESTVDDECSAQAIRTLGEALPPERAAAILHDALRKRLFQAARACLETLGASGNPAVVETLAKVMDLERDDLVAAAALALGATGNANAEPALLRALERDSLEVRVAAATALSRVGSAAAVMPLKEAAHRFPSTAELHKAARHAIVEIQSRLQGASPGQLSLASPEAGQLSLAQADAGQLSLAGEQAGELSLLGPHLPDPPLPKGEGKTNFCCSPSSPLGRGGPGR